MKLSSRTSDMHDIPLLKELELVSDAQSINIVLLRS